MTDRGSLCALIGVVATLSACAEILGFEEGRAAAPAPHDAAGGGTSTSTVSVGGGGRGGDTGYASAVLNDGPCGYWRLGEDMPPVAWDASGNERHGTYVGVALGVAGALAGDPDTAAVFDGASGTKLEIDSDAFRFLGTTAFSVELWVNPPALAGGFPTVIGQFEDLGLQMNGWWIYAKESSTVFWREDGVDTTAAIGPALTLGTFTHLVATYDGTTMQLYLNGDITDENNSSLRIADHDQPLVVGGRYTGDSPFAATIDEVAIYCRALSPPEVLAHYRAATSR